MIELENRVTKLEDILAQFISETRYSINKLVRTTENFQNQIKEFKQEAERDRKKRDAEMKEFKQEAERDRKKRDAEMKEFKDEMKEFKQEAERDRKRFNKQLGEISNKQGKLVEDLIAPAIRPAIKKYFNEDILDIFLNRRKHLKSKNIKGEFDAVAVSENAVYLVEEKSAPLEKHLTKFENNIKTFRILFPEYQKLKLIPIFAALVLDEDMISKISQSGFYALAYREWEYMDILNFDEINRNKNPN